MKRSKPTHSFRWQNCLSLSMLWTASLLITIFGGSRIALTVCFVLPVLVGVSLLMQWIFAKKLSVSLSLPIGAVQKGETIEGTLKIKNDTWIPVHGFLCELEYRNTYTEETGTVYVNGAVSSMETGESTFCVPTKHCGYMQVRVRKLRLFDLFCMVSVPVSVQSRKRGTPVFPTLYPVRILPRAMMFRSFSASDRMTQMKGQDFSEVFQLREYVPGDSLRQVHWKLTEKTDKLIVKDGVSFARQAVLVFLDTRDAAENPDFADALADATASVCAALGDSGISIDLAWRDEDGIRREPVHKTEDFHVRILEAIRHSGKQLQGDVTTLDDGETQVLYFTQSLPQDYTVYQQTGRYLFMLCGKSGDRDVCAFLPGHLPMEVEV